MANPRLQIISDGSSGCDRAFLTAIVPDETRTAVATIRVETVFYGSDGQQSEPQYSYSEQRVFGAERRELGCRRYQPFPGNLYGHSNRFQIVRTWWENEADSETWF